MLLHFSKPENGGYRCVAPNLRGFEKSSQPTEVSAYRAKFLVQDITELIQIESQEAPLKALVAHDWGGALAWGLGLDWLIWQTLPASHTWWGAAIIIGSGLYLVRREKRITEVHANAEHP